MNRYIKIICILIWLLPSVSAYADKYPRNYSIDILHYSFSLILSDLTDEIKGTASITVLFKKEDIKKIRLDFINNTEERKGKGMNIESIMMDNKSVTFIHKNDEVWIDLPVPSSTGSQMVFVIRYHGVPADGLKIGPTKYGDRSFFSENWSNKARHWLPCVDHPYDKATSEFIVQAPFHYQVISNGLLLEESNVDSVNRRTHWKQWVPVSCWLFVLGVADFAVQHVGDVYGKAIQTWVYAKDRDAGFYDFAEPTKQVVEYFSEYIGPYAYEKVANISATIQGGMETSSAIFYGENLINGKRTETIRNIVIHELAHQWFGNAVTESTWDDAWLSEGFATYFTMLYLEHAFGREEYVKKLQQAKNTIYRYYEKNGDYSIIADRSAEEGSVTSVITYQKGAWVLHMLRDMIGAENFRKGIRSYYSRFYNANATTNDFLFEMEKVSGKDLKPFFKQWLYQGKNLILKGNWTYDQAKKELHVKLDQSENKDYLFDVPVEIGISSGGVDEMKIHTFRLNTKTAEFIIPVKSMPRGVIFDPRTVLLAQVDFRKEQKANNH